MSEQCGNARIRHISDTDVDARRYEITARASRSVFADLTKLGLRPRQNRVNIAHAPIIISQAPLRAAHYNAQ